jgi:peptidoglycan/LPS O-acetylase OafA/YrhL
MWHGPALPASRVVYAVLPWIVAGAGLLWRWLHPAPLVALPGTGLGLGRVSYALYVIHVPVMYLSAGLFPIIAMRVVFVFVTVPLLVAVMEYLIHPWFLRNLFDRRAGADRTVSRDRRSKQSTL